MRLFPLTSTLKQGLLRCRQITWKTPAMKLVSAILQEMYSLASTFQGFRSDLLLSIKISRYFRKVYFWLWLLTVVRFSKDSFPQKFSAAYSCLRKPKRFSISSWSCISSWWNGKRYTLFQIAIYSKICSFLFMQLRRIQNAFKFLRRRFLWKRLTTFRC